MNRFRYLAKLATLALSIMLAGAAFAAQAPGDNGQGRGSAEDRAARQAEREARRDDRRAERRERRRQTVTVPELDGGLAWLGLGLLVAFTLLIRERRRADLQ